MQWTPPAPAGTRVWLQAVLLDNAGVVRDVDVPHPVDVVPAVPGCMFSGSPDFNPLATFDDGSCVCPRTADAHSLADLVPLLPCTGIERLTIDGALNGAIALPNLQSGHIEVTGATGVTGLEVHALRDGLIRLEGVEGAFDLEFPSSVSVGVLANASPALRSVRVPANASLSDLTLTWNPNVTSVTLDGTGDLSLADIGWNDTLQTIHIASDLVLGAEAYGNPGLTSVTLTGTNGVGVLDVRGNPALDHVEVAAARLGRFVVSENDVLERIAVPNATEARKVDLSFDPSLVTLDMSSLTTVHQLEVIATGSAALAFPALTTAPDLAFASNPSLQTIDLSALQTGFVAVDDNPSFCATADPWFVHPPPGVTVTGSNNLCDP